MIDETFIHLSGIGPRTCARFRDLGFRNWNDFIVRESELPVSAGRKSLLLREIGDDLHALQNEDIDYLVNRFPVSEHWRLLGRYFDKATFFDIETTGLSYHSSRPSVIVALDRDGFHRYVSGRDLDGFLDLCASSELLVSFNGNSFDIPFLENFFHVPSLGCPHVDLRWVAYHAGHRGGLKAIEKSFGLRRPPHIIEVDGCEAVDLYYAWQGGDGASLEKLIEYCACDVISTAIVSAMVLRERGYDTPVPDFNRLYGMFDFIAC